ncbi:MAG: hypothetical protein IH986_12990 [Planctomycetes bacterium]|nr:hypothetical protein [Planctomycetota bacterium]
MPRAARIDDPVSHPWPPALTGGPGSPNVTIGGRRAWRALPAALGGAVQAAAVAMQALMDALLLNPALAAPLLVNIDIALHGASRAAATEGNPAAVASATTALTALHTTNTTMTTAWTTASAAPGGQPAADEAYAEGLRAAAAATAAALFSTIGAMFDMHVCCTPLPAHGPGLVTVGSSTVSVNGLPLARESDPVMEASGGANAIVGGCTTVSTS